jgi:hypothetical protein
MWSKHTKYSSVTFSTHLTAHCARQIKIILMRLGLSKKSSVSYLINYLITYLLTYLLTPWIWVLVKLTGFQLVKKFPTFYGTRKFITAFTSALHLSLSCATSIQSIRPHPISWRCNLTLSSHLRLGLPSGFFSLRFPHPHPLYVSPLPHTRYMPRPYHSSRFYDPNNIGWAVQII